MVAMNYVVWGVFANEKFMVTEFPHPLEILDPIFEVVLHDTKILIEKLS